MKRGTPDHVKFHDLCIRLGIRRYQAMGVLEGIWHLAATQAKRGDIGKWSNEKISAWLQWERNADDLVNALVDSGWLDRDDTHRLVVHDWADHCDQTVRRSEDVKNHGLIAKANYTGPKAQNDAPKPTLAGDLAQAFAPSSPEPQEPLPTPLSPNELIAKRLAAQYAKTSGKRGLEGKAHECFREALEAGIDPQALEQAVVTCPKLATPWEIIDPLRNKPATDGKPKASGASFKERERESEREKLRKAMEEAERRQGKTT